MKTCETFWANIYMGLQAGYTDEEVYSQRQAEYIVRQYCDKVGLGVTVTSTTFIYTGGSEPGVIIGLINYPRFPSWHYQIAEHAEEIGKQLATKFGQERFSIVYPGETVMYEKGLDYV